VRFKRAKRDPNTAQRDADLTLDPLTLGDHVERAIGVIAVHRILSQS